MEEFNERVSVIGKSPVIVKIWQCSYRQVCQLTLVLLLVVYSSVLYAQDDKVTRLQLVSAIYERIYNRQVTELEAINTGLLDAYEDGKFHLEWPVSRGMVAEAFYRLHIQSGNAARLPRAFADITPDSPFARVLAVVGGAFLPQKRGNFHPNHMLTRKNLFRAIQVLIDKNVVKQENRYAMEIAIINRPIVTVASVTQSLEELAAVHTELGFGQRSSDSEKFRQQAYKRFGKADRQVTSEQMNPQVMSSVEDATAAMTDVETLLKSLGGSVMEMTDTHPSNPEDEKVLRQGLAKIENVLKIIVDRFEFSKLQLNTVMPADPDQIKKCVDLDLRLNQTIEQAEILRRRISARLAETVKGN